MTVTEDIKMCFAGWYRIGDTAFNCFDEIEKVHKVKGWKYVYNLGIKLPFTELTELQDDIFNYVFKEGYKNMINPEIEAFIETIIKTQKKR